jgi:acetoin utilization deacetylase AcuC-like enzyme
MTTIFYSHEACEGHDPGPGHPECPARLAAVGEALEAPEFANLERRQAPLCDPDRIALAHPRAYVEAVLSNIPNEGYAAFDGDTVVSPGSGEAALRATGALVAAADAVMAGEAANAFCAVRPPGHHAEAARAMGFCLFNNVAVAAMHLRDRHGLRRIAVVDFDVHHGNGTQAIFWNEADFLFASTHQMPLFPGSGSASETGCAGNIVNVPLAPFAGSVEFRKAMEREILPAVSEFAPEFLLVSAGFDAHKEDPLANLNFQDEDFAWVTRELVDLAGRHCGGRIVSTLEGGYNLSALGRGVAAHVRALMAA